MSDGFSGWLLAGTVFVNGFVLDVDRVVEGSSVNIANHQCQQ